MSALNPATTDETRAKARAGGVKGRHPKNRAATTASSVDFPRQKRAGDVGQEEVSKQLENQLRKLTTVMGAVTDFIYHFDLEGRFTYANQSLLDLWQKTREEAIGRNFHELDYPPDLAAKLQRQIQQVIETRRPLKDETPYTSAIGSRQYEYIFFPVLTDDGSVEAVAGVTRDITDRREAERALRENEARFRAMFEQAHIGIVQIAADGHFIAVNPGACALGGYAEEELLRMTVADVTHPDDLAREQELSRKLLAGEIPDYTLEKRYVRKNGSIVWGNMTATLVRDAARNPLYVLAILEPIDERKKAEKRLRFSEERFRQFADNSADVFWIVDAKNEQLEYLNPVFERMWGEPRETLMRDIRRWNELVHPDDREKASTAMPRVLAGETFVVEYRIVRPSDGAVRWIRETAFPIHGKNGAINRVAGVEQDVTDDKNSAEALRASEERLRLLVEGAGDYAMFLLDPDNTITYWNAGAEKVFGWRAEEAIGQKGELIFTPEDRAREQEEKELQTARKNGFAPDQRWHLRKDGSRIWVDGVMRRLDHQDGSLRGFAKIARDATELHNRETELRAAHDQLELRVHQRTSELQAMNESLEQEMTRRQTLERQILQVTERERARIGQDLHDTLCQELTATAFLLKSRSRSLAREDPEAAEALSEAAETVNANAGLARDLARGFHPFELGAGGLVSALQELAARTTENVTCRCDCPRALRVANEDVAVNLYRIAQEAVSNAVKHAKPNEIVICIERQDGEIVLSICDDGKSIPKNKRAGRMGIHMMQYRANVSGGTLQIDSKRGSGTKVTCRVPAKK